MIKLFFELTKYAHLVPSEGVNRVLSIRLRISLCRREENIVTLNTEYVFLK